MLKLLAFVLPLGLDSFAVAAAIGATQPTTSRAQLRISVVFVIFEAGMPLIGVAAGGGLARVIGPAAGFLAAGAVIAVGIWMLVARDDDDQIAGARGLAVVALGISISLDEFAVGFSLGLARLPVVAVIIAIAVQAVVASQLGLALGTVISDRLREHAEQVAGLALIVLGGYLMAERALS